MPVLALSTVLGDVLLALLAIVAQALIVVVLVVGIRRILGSGLGWFRTVGVVVVALGVGIPLSTALAIAFGIGTTGGELLVPETVALGFFAVAALWIFAACLATMMVLEVLVPSGSVPGPREAWKRTAGWFRRTRRYVHILRAASGSGLGTALREGPSSASFGPALAEFFNRSGVTFVKLGQVLATREDLLPAEVTRALAALQSSAAPEPLDAVSETIRSELHGPPDAVFARFEAVPLAAASAAQVHTATTRDGRDVVVKVQRRDARRQILADTDILVRLAGTAEQRWAWAREMGVSALAAGLSRSLREELDYRHEAVHTTSGAAALRAWPDIAVPAVDPGLTGDRVLVMERLDGIPLSRGTEAVASLEPDRRTQLADALIGATLESVLATGVFHADLHPGNILVLRDGRLGVLDFGAVGILDSETRHLLAVLLLAALNDDAVTATDALVLAFDTPDDLDVGRLRRDLGREITSLQLQTTIGRDMFGRIFAVVRDHGIGVPGDVAAALRTFSSVEAAVRILDPDSSLLLSARAQLPSLLQRLVDPQRTAAHTLGQAGVLAAVARRLPERVEHISRTMREGNLSVRTRPFGSGEDRSWARSQVTDILAAVFGMIACILAVVLILHDGGPLLTPRLSLSALFGMLLGFFGITLALRVVIGLFRRR